MLFGSEIGGAVGVIGSFWFLEAALAAGRLLHVRVPVSLVALVELDCLRGWRAEPSRLPMELAGFGCMRSSWAGPSGLSAELANCLLGLLGGLWGWLAESSGPCAQLADCLVELAGQLGCLRSCRAPLSGQCAELTDSLVEVTGQLGCLRSW